MSGKVAVSGTSLSFTLPMCCQICLGKVKEPVICPNQHVFCATCMGAWLASHSCCPTCRTPITSDEPCKKILGSLDLPMNSDSSTRVELRRTRLELIRQEYEEEISTLQSTTERLRSENKELQQKLLGKDNTPSVAQLASSDATDGKVDICMLVNLTTKLQEASINCELLTKDTLKLKQENRRLREDNENLLRENARLKDDNLFNKSPQRYGRYSMAGLQTKVNQYEREVQQLKRALSRSDAYIEELTTKISQNTAPEARAAKNKASRSSLPALPSASSVTTLEAEHASAVNGTSTQSPARPSSAPGQVYSAPSSTTDPEEGRAGDSLCEQDKAVKLVPERNVHSNGFAVAEGHYSNGSPGYALDRLSDHSQSFGDPFDPPQEFVARKPPPPKRLMDEDLNVFTASRKLMQLSENLNRKRVVGLPESSRVHAELSPSRSDSPGRTVAPCPPETDLIAEAPSSPQILPVSESERPLASSAPARDEIVSNTSSSEDSTPDLLNTFSLAKIKTEISAPCQGAECPLKKVKLERPETAVPE